MNGLLPGADGGKLAKRTPLGDIAHIVNPFSVYVARRRSTGKAFLIVTSDCEGQTRRDALTPDDARWLIAHLQCNLARCEGYPPPKRNPEPWRKRFRRWLQGAGF